jgi:hypothetical protein
MTLASGSVPEGLAGSGVNGLTLGPLRLSSAGYRRQASGLPEATRASLSLHLEIASGTPVL